MDEATDPSRPRGILNERERRYLRGEADIKSRSQTERDIRATIRTRLRHALFDFALLFDHMADRDISQVFDPRAEDSGAMRTAIENTIGFFYRATIDYHPPFHYLAKEGIQRAEQQHFDRYVQATVDVEATAPIDPDRIREKMMGAREERLTPEEAMWIAETTVASGDIAFDDLEQAHEQVREQRAGQKPPDEGDTADGNRG
jgi:hypothetical protein